MKDLLTVIIPVYNVEPYLRRCVESVLVQNYESIEVILIDDGSTDGSSIICDEFSEMDNIVVIHQTNQGLSMARNAGLEVAHGEYITFLDSDDFIEHDMYSTLIELMCKHEKDIAACATSSFYEDGIIVDEAGFDGSIRLIDGYEMLGDLYCNQNARSEVWNKVYKRKIIEGVRFKKDQKFEDLYFDRIIFQKSNGCVFINKPFHHYLVARPGNTNSSFDSHKLCAFEELEDIRSDLIKKGHSDDAEKILAMQLLFSMLLGCQCYEFKGKPEDKRYLNAKFKEYKEKNANNDYIKNIKRRVTLYSISPILLNIVLRIRNKV